MLSLWLALAYPYSLRKEVISLGMLPPSWPDIGAEHALPLVIPAAEHKSLLKGIPMVGKDFPQVSRVDDAKFSKLDSAGRQLFLTSKKKQYNELECCKCYSPWVFNRGYCSICYKLQYINCCYLRSYNFK